MKSAAIYISFLQQNFSFLLHKLVIFARGILIFCRRISTFGRGIFAEKFRRNFFFAGNSRVPESLLNEEDIPGAKLVKPIEKCSCAVLRR